MSVQVQQYKVDDLAAAKDPETDVLADGTVHFAFDDQAWEIDLTAENREKFFKKLGPYIQAGRRLRGRKRARSRPMESRNRARDIRRWAADHHIEVSERGRIPAAVIEQYQQATGG